MRARATLSLLCAVCACGLVATADEDAVRNGLVKARAAHKEAVEAAKDGVLGYLKNKAEVARKAGDFDLLKQFQAEAEAFRKDGKLPKSVPVQAARDYEKALKTAHAGMEASYKAALKQYTIDNKLALAEAVRGELDEFKKGGGIAPGQTWVSLFNGRDVDRWKQFGNETHKWTVSGGVLTGDGVQMGAASLLMTQKADYVNFHVRFETKQADGLNSAIAFRVSLKQDSVTGYYAAISGSNPNAPYATGDIYYSPMFTAAERKTLTKANTGVPLQPGKWHLQEVIVRDNQMTVILNGKVVARTTDPNKSLDSGAIGILCRAGSKVHVRKIDIKELPAATNP
jgi:hypothetical protein